MEIVKILLLVIFAVSAFLLILLVLAQDEQGEGIGGMFSGGSSTTFGSRAGNILTKTTSILGFIFLSVSLILAFLFRTPDTGNLGATFQSEAVVTEWWTEDQPVVEDISEPLMTTLENPSQP